MTAEELESFEERFKEIKMSPVRNTRLTALKKDLEDAYNIPEHYSVAFINNNLEVMRLYRDVCYAVDLERVR
ncbi:hypothetical protein BME96_12640 [Virgibacillus halodenitrificans]|uniref:Uncharacterized protein n=1 Tax=Virgibacillus halodenitrificans TaxID=1482 RepID=A0AAC9J1T6_VIRHA|nr:hypothetical protein [Virgibacillus halodenitrificans]APC48987.1 hypothetical protein BME96_12640 [Virgibacillus halodenitrificans]